MQRQNASGEDKIRDVKDADTLALETIEDIPTFWCWDDMVRFDVTGREAHADHDTTLREVEK